jgi:hypothetical protein
MRALPQRDALGQLTAQAATSSGPHTSQGAVLPVQRLLRSARLS